jgi:hypothetical protein
LRSRSIATVIDSDNPAAGGDRGGELLHADVRGLLDRVEPVDHGVAQQIHCDGHAERQVRRAVGDRGRQLQHPDVRGLLGAVEALSDRILDAAHALQHAGVERLATVVDGGEDLLHAGVRGLLRAVEALDDRVLDAAHPEEHRVVGGLAARDDLGGDVVHALRHRRGQPVQRRAGGGGNLVQLGAHGRRDLAHAVLDGAERAFRATAPALLGLAHILVDLVGDDPESAIDGVVELRQCRGPLVGA